MFPVVLELNVLNGSVVGLIRWTGTRRRSLGKPSSRRQLEAVGVQHAGDAVAWKGWWGWVASVVRGRAAVEKAAIGRDAAEGQIITCLLPPGGPGV